VLPLGSSLPSVIPRMVALFRAIFPACYSTVLLSRFCRAGRHVRKWQAMDMVIAIRAYHVAAFHALNSSPHFIATIHASCHL